MRLFSPSPLCMHPPPPPFSTQRTFYPSHTLTSMYVPLNAPSLYLLTSRISMCSGKKREKNEKRRSLLCFLASSRIRGKEQEKSARKGVGISNRPQHEPNTQDKKKKRINSQTKTQSQPNATAPLKPQDSSSPPPASSSSAADAAQSYSPASCRGP